MLIPNRDQFIIFSGGMPRASYGDKHTVSVMQGQNHVVLDFTSKVIDFVTLTRAQECDTEEERAGKTGLPAGAAWVVRSLLLTPDCYMFLLNLY